MGNVDKMLRVLIAVVIAVLYWQGIIGGTLAIVLLVFSGVFLLTSLLSFCPLYLIFGLNTCKVKKE